MGKKEEPKEKEEPTLFEKLFRNKKPKKLRRNKDGKK